MQSSLERPPRPHEGINILEESLIVMAAVRWMLCDVECSWLNRMTQRAILSTSRMG
jgi:hypothetical protein